VMSLVARAALRAICISRKKRRRWRRHRTLSINEARRHPGNTGRCGICVEARGFAAGETLLIHTAARRDRHLVAMGGYSLPKRSARK